MEATLDSLRFRSSGYFRILAEHAAAAVNSTVADPSVEGERPIQLVPVLQRLPLDIIGSVMFLLPMKGTVAAAKFRCCRAALPIAKRRFRARSFPAPREALPSA
jgi:hypothetical protein